MSRTIAAVGDADSVMLFQAVGIDAVVAENPLDAGRALRRLANEGYSLIYITEQTARMAKDIIREFKNQTYPVVIAVPGRQKSTGAGMASIRDNVIKAVGKEIF
ncbi:MAG: V-type ATP synthase subunit F [Christensenellales bacterium]